MKIIELVDYRNLGYSISFALGAYLYFKFYNGGKVEKKMTIRFLGCFITKE